MMYKNILSNLKIIYFITFIVFSSFSYGDTNTEDMQKVIKYYIESGQVRYNNSYILAKEAQQQIYNFLHNPNENTLLKARNSWIKAKNIYSKTEVFRFGNPIVDEWEPKVNSWPIDEGLIDYVSNDYAKINEDSSLYTANIIANKMIHVDGELIDVSKFTPKVLIDILLEAEGNEANVSVGFHAIEFMLWGQDLNGNGPGAGNRSYTDFSLENCTNGNCKRRRNYLKAVTDILVDHLHWMSDSWKPGGDAYNFVKNKTPNEAIEVILTGMGSLSYGELAGERMTAPLLLGDPEDTHDCFSDNTHNSLYYNEEGIYDVYIGKYTKINGTVVNGPSISDLVKKLDPNLDKKIKSDMNATMKIMNTIVSKAKKGLHFDQLISTENIEGRSITDSGIKALFNQTRSIKKVVKLLGAGKTSFGGSDSLKESGSTFK